MIELPYIIATTLVIILVIICVQRRWEINNFVPCQQQSVDQATLEQWVVDLVNERVEAKLKLSERLSEVENALTEENVNVNE